MSLSEVDEMAAIFTDRTLTADLVNVQSPINTPLQSVSQSHTKIRPTARGSALQTPRAPTLGVYEFRYLYSFCVVCEIIRLYGRYCVYTVDIVYGIGVNYETVCILPALSYNKSTTVLICLTVSNAASYVFYHISKHFHKTYIRSLFVEDIKTSSTVI